MGHSLIPDSKQLRGLHINSLSHKRTKNSCQGNTRILCPLSVVINLAFEAWQTTMAYLGL